jgi:hypothetical protein
MAIQAQNCGVCSIIRCHRNPDRFLIFMVILAISILILAMLVIWQSSVFIKKEGLPGGKLIYADHRQWKSVTTPLFDRALGLTGKPDYIVNQGRQFIHSGCAYFSVGGLLLPYPKGISSTTHLWHHPLYSQGQSATKSELANLCH